MVAAELLIVTAIAASAAYLLAQNQDLADRILFTRKVVFGLAGLAGSLILIGTGSWPLVFVGGVIFFLIWLWVFREQPYEGVV